MRDGSDADGVVEPEVGAGFVDDGVEVSDLLECDAVAESDGIARVT